MRRFPRSSGHAGTVKKNQPTCPRRVLGDYSHSRSSHPLSFQLLSLEDRWPVERLKVEKATFLATRDDDLVYTMCRCRSRLCNPQKKGSEEEGKWKDLAGKGLKKEWQSMSTMRQIGFSGHDRLFFVVLNFVIGLIWKFLIITI